MKLWREKYCLCKMQGIGFKFWIWWNPWLFPIKLAYCCSTLSAFYNVYLDFDPFIISTFRSNTSAVGQLVVLPPITRWSIQLIFPTIRWDTLWSTFCAAQCITVRWIVSHIFMTNFFAAVMTFVVVTWFAKPERKEVKKYRDTCN